MAGPRSLLPADRAFSVFSVLLSADIQWADSPLDSSEAMSLGGVVRVLID